MSEPVLYWIRRDFRTRDNPALAASAATGRPVIPVFVLEPGLGAAPLFRLGLGLAELERAFEALGSRVILRQGPAADALDAVLAETGATMVVWNRLYDPEARDRDSAIKADLKARGLAVQSFAGHLLTEPWEVQTGTGGPYRVFTPFWRAIAGREPMGLIPPPGRLTAPSVWPSSQALADWNLAAGMRRGAAITGAWQSPGETAALARLEGFAEAGLAGYKGKRDLPAADGTSRLSAALSLGEIAPARIWHMLQGQPGAEPFLRQLAWRDFAWHLMFHFPRLAEANWRPEWDDFPWDSDASRPEVLAWQQGRTGVPFVDAAMRELYVTGHMHNRARMIVASYLTKHLMAHWKIGLDWFEAHLTDWDAASNAMGWQWVAGSGPDAAPYFRIFNPVTQAEKFDKGQVYLDRWIAEGRRPSETALSYFDAVPESWGLRPDASYPAPVVALDVGRRRALAAYEARRKDP